MRLRVCDHAGSRIVDGAAVHPRRPDLVRKRYVLCFTCGAYVGCHPDGRPMGTPADAATRAARLRAHGAFDPLWRSGTMTRGEAYAWLAETLRVTEAHIGEMDEITAARVERLGAERARELGIDFTGEREGR